MKRLIVFEDSISSNRYGLQVSDLSLRPENQGKVLIFDTKNGSYQLDRKQILDLIDGLTKWTYIGLTTSVQDIQRRSNLLIIDDPIKEK